MVKDQTEEIRRVANSLSAVATLITNDAMDEGETERKLGELSSDLIDVICTLAREST